jgi:ankyrin repeat protein
VLAGPPLNLSDFYNKSIERIEKGGRAETAKRILFLTLSSRIPLTILEVQDAVAALDAQPSGANHEDCRPLEKTLWDCCAGLVVVNVESKVVSFAHESVRGYLSSDNVRTKLFLFDLQTQMAGMCLKYLTYDTFGSGPYKGIDTYRKRLDDYPFLRYAAQHWGHHIRGPPEQKLMQETLAFLRQDAKLSCAVQAMHVPKSQDKAGAFPRNVHGLWIASTFGLDEVLMRLLQEGQADPDAPDSDGQTGLMMAAKQGHAASVRSLLEGKAYLEMKDRSRTSDLETENLSRKAYLELQDRSDFTALLWAAKRGHQECVQVLFEKGANIDAADGDGETSLIGAARRWDETMLQVLLEHKANIDARDRFGDTALIRAAKRGRTATVRYLIGKGADFRKVDEMKRTALIAASEEGHESVVELIVEKLDKLEGKTLIETMDCNMETALIRAVKRRHISVVEILLRYGANIEATDQFGNRPLFLAAGQGHGNLVDVLLRMKPNLEAENEDGQTALMAAADGGHKSILFRLLEQGADPEKLERHGETALISAIRKGHESTILVLLSKSVSGIEKWDRFGETALIAACQKSRENASMNGIVLRLLESGANVNNQGRKGKGPLHWAVEDRNIILIKLLLDRGANVDHQDSNSETPLFCAAERGMTDVAKLLLDHGADMNGNNISENYHEKMVSLLVKRGADMEVHTYWGDSALSSAIARCHTDMVRQLADEMRKRKSEREFMTYLWLVVCRRSGSSIAKRARFLVEMGFDINAEGVKGETLLDNVWMSWAEAADVGKLLDLGATQGSRHTAGQTLLTAAVSVWSSGLIEAHLDRGADIEERNGEHQTPLIAAIQLASALEGETKRRSPVYNTIEVLLRKWARVDAKDRAGRTPLDLAIQGGDTTVAKLLVNYGATMDGKNREPSTKLLSLLNEDAMEKEEVLMVTDREEQSG